MAVHLAIRINDGPVVVAGDPLLDVLAATITLVRARDEIELEAGGLLAHSDHDKEHLDWVHHALHVGDKVTIEVVDVSEGAAPTKRERLDPAFAAREERAYYEHLKAKYEPGG